MDTEEQQMRMELASGLMERAALFASQPHRVDTYYKDWMADLTDFDLRMMVPTMKMYFAMGFDFVIDPISRTRCVNLAKRDTAVFDAEIAKRGISQDDMSTTVHMTPEQAAHGGAVQMSVPEARQAYADGKIK